MKGREKGTGREGKGGNLKEQKGEKGRKKEGNGSRGGGENEREKSEGKMR